MGGEELFQVNLGGPQRKSQARGRQKETDRGRRDVLLETAWSRGDGETRRRRKALEVERINAAYFILRASRENLFCLHLGNWF